MQAAAGLGAGLGAGGAALFYYYRSGRAGTYRVEMPCNTARYEHQAWTKRGWLYNTVSMAKCDIQRQCELEAQYDMDVAPPMTWLVDTWTLRPVEMVNARPMGIFGGAQLWYHKDARVEDTKSYKDDKKLLDELFEK